MKNVLNILIADKRTFLVLYLILCAIVTFQAFNPSSPNDPNAKYHYVDYNNYVIFKQAYVHLMNDQDLYVYYLNEHDDLYKYTPTFAVFFGFFAALPDTIGLYCWNFLNVFLLIVGVYLLPKLSLKEKGFLLLLVTIELVTSIQNEQSNGLMVGLLLCAFGLLEKGKYQWATFLIVFSIYIKLFSIVGLILFLFYPKKLKLAAYTGLWFILFFMIPLIYVSVDQYVFLWKSYGNMLANDHSNSLGFSVMGILNSWFGLDPSKLGLVSVGGVLLLLPFLKFKSYGDQRFRILALAFVLIWTVIFNHKAESPTFIISMVGIALWYLLTKKDAASIGILIFAFVFTSLSSTDLFPPFVRENFIKPFAIKAVGSVLVWCLIFIEMMRYRPKFEDISANK
jgi:hypothetical protein